MGETKKVKIGSISRNKLIKTIQNEKKFSKIGKKLKISTQTITKKIKGDEELLTIYQQVNKKRSESTISQNENVSQNEIISQNENVSKFENKTDEYLFNYFKNRNTQSFSMQEEDILKFQEIMLKMYKLNINIKCKYQLIESYIKLYNYIKNKYKDENNQSV
jgi:hypothetical protein